MTHAGQVPAGNAVVVSKNLDAIAWGLFFIWVGVALTANVGWGLGLIGIGAITLAAQVARRYFGLAAEGFWVVVGLLFFLGGVWELLGVRFSLVPIVLIVAGLALLFSVRKVKA